MRADGGDVVHLPGARLIAIAAAGERANGADVDAHAALLAVELAGLAVGSNVVGGDDGDDAAILHADGPHVHALTAHADAAVTEDAAGAVVVDGGRPLLLVAVRLGLGVKAFACAVLEGHVLQFALAAGIADGAVEGVVAKQEFDGGFARLDDFRRLGDKDLALRDGGGAGGLQLGHFFLADQAHAAGGLQAEAGVVAEGRDFDAGFAAGFNEQHARGSGELFSVDGESYVWHLNPCALALFDL